MGVTLLRCLYERHAVKKFFSRSAFLLFLRFKEGSCERSSALMARQAPLLGRAFAVNPRSPQGRAGRREGLTAKARAELQWCPAITLRL